MSTSCSTLIWVARLFLNCIFVTDSWVISIVAIIDIIEDEWIISFDLQFSQPVGGPTCNIKIVFWIKNAASLVSFSTFVDSFHDSFHTAYVISFI